MAITRLLYLQQVTLVTTHDCYHGNMVTAVTTRLTTCDGYNGNHTVTVVTTGNRGNNTRLLPW